MKKMVSGLTTLIMLSAMVSCGTIDTADNSGSSKSTSAAASGTEADIKTTVSAETESGSQTTAADSGEKGTKTTPNNDKHGQVEITDNIQDIVGFWLEDNALDPRLLTINEDGSYKLAYEGGGSRFGTVKLVTEVYPDITVSYYRFNDSQGELWEYFFRNVIDETNDSLSAGQGEDQLNFVRFNNTDNASGVNKDPAPTVPEAKDIRDALDFADKLMCGSGVKTDANEEYRTDDGTVYHKSIDNIYTTTAIVRERLTRYMTDSFISSRYAYLTGTGTPKCIDVNGMLYIEYRPIGGRYCFGTEDPVITDSADYPNGYSILLKNNDYGAEVTVTVDVVKDNGSWKIAEVHDSF